MKLWQKDNASTNELIEKFTVGRDKEFDLLLARYDVQGSIAHVKMLQEVGLMSKADGEQAVKGLEIILEDLDQQKFAIEDGIRDLRMSRGLEMCIRDSIREAFCVSAKP